MFFQGGQDFGFYLYQFLVIAHIFLISQGKAERQNLQFGISQPKTSKFNYIIVTHFYIKLELMFMKHYAPYRCLYIKVAKLRTGVGCAEMSLLHNCGLKIYLKRALGGGGGGSGWGGQVGEVRCERRSEVFVKIQKKKLGGGQCGCDRRIEVFGKFTKKKKKSDGGGGGGGGGREGSGWWGVRVDVKEELKFL